MTLQQLHYFRVLTEIQHYTRASEALSISQPSLSASISDLEKELGVKLFDRMGKHITLSEAGKIFLKYAKAALDSLEQGRYEMQHYSETAEKGVSVGYIFSTARDVQNILLGFQIDCSDDTVTIKHTLQHSNDIILDMLAADRADIVFCTAPPKDTEYKKLYDQELFFTVAKDHPLAVSKQPVNEEMLKNDPMVMLSEVVNLHNTIEAHFEKWGIKPNVSCAADECNAAAAYVAAGYGYTIIPGLPGVEPSGVVMLDSGDFTVTRPIYMVWKKDRVLSPNAERLKKYVCDMYE